MDKLDSLISPQQLAACIGAPDVKVIDATWTLPGSTSGLPSGYIPSAAFYDLGAIKAMPLTAQTVDVLAQSVSAIGLTPDDHAVIYDRHGLFSAPRLWWILRRLGHESVSILDGGLPAWVAAGFDTHETPAQPAQTQYKASAPLIGSAVMDEVKACLDCDTHIIDARPQGRFDGTLPEPREGLRSGHIPGSACLPFSSFKAADGTLLPLEAIKGMMQACGITMDAPIITTCGSGVTAAGLAFIFHLLGKDDVSVYSGSWAEWGASDAPIAIS